MKITNYRNPKGKDLGPHRIYGNEINPLLKIGRPMPAGKTWHDTQHKFLFAKDETRVSPEQQAEARRAKAREDRIANIDHYRRLEVERNRRYRARKKEAA